MHFILAGTGLGFIAFGVAGNRLYTPEKAYVAEAIRPIGQLPGGAAVVAAGLAILFTGAAGARLARRGRHLAGLRTMVATMCIGFLAADALFVPRANSRLSARPVTGEMERLVPPGAGEVGIYPARPPSHRGEAQYSYSGAFNVYSKRLLLTRLADEAAVARFLAEPGRRLVLAGQRAVKTGFPELPPGVREIPAGRVDRTEIVFLVNFDPE
jgi:hypothetical protein